MQKKTLAVFLTLFISVFLISTATADDFPLREKYPDVKYMTTDELAANYDSTIIVDVRSAVEFDVAHINNAVNISIAKKTFSNDLEELRAKDGAKAIATYCNGHTCAKSYKAVKKAMGDGFNNIYAYDAGIFDWIMANPDKATLMGQSPAPKDKIIPKANLKAKMLSWSEFSAKAEEADAVSIDIRDPFQRKEIPKIPKLRNIPMDRLTKLLEKKQFIDQPLLILDAVGKQVRWLQYHLEANGYSNYYFLEKGMKGIN